MSQDSSQFDTEKRLLLAIILSMLVLFGAPYVYRQIHPPAPVPEQAEVAEKPATPTPPQAKEAKPTTPKEAVPPPVETPVTPTQAKPETVTVQNDDLTLKWNNVGAVLESALLKTYTEQGKPVELVTQGLPREFSRPFEIEVSDEALTQELKQAVFQVHREPAAGATRLIFEYRSPRVQVTRRVTVPQSGYLLDVDTQVTAGGRTIPYSVILGPGIGPEGYSNMGDFASPEVVDYQNDSVERYAPKSVKEGPKDLQQGNRWVGLDIQYFTYFVYKPDSIRQVQISSSEWTRKNLEGKEEAISLVKAKVGFPGSNSYQLFFGPKDYQVLEGIDPSLTKLINYGWFGILVKPLLYSLKFIYRYIGNYGWAIIILTFVINLALFPVRYKQMVSMKKMSELQPKLRSIQDRYKRMKKDDPRRQQMNVEVMALYKQHGVNPLGGCLPLVIQMPFLFAFYRMLASSIELRGAPFVLWIHDLSQRDPYYITPIVMGITMLLQQKMTPSTGDPSQKKMMMFLPIVFTFFFLNVSSGLALYFLFSNVFGMMFQLLLQKWSPALQMTGTPKKVQSK